MMEFKQQKNFTQNILTQFSPHILKLIAKLHVHKTLDYWNQVLIVNLPSLSTIFATYFIICGCYYKLS